MISYFDLVLQRSIYPDGFPQAFRLAFVPESRQLVVEYQLPTVSIVPAVKAFKYVKASDTVTESPRPVAQVRGLYASVVAQVTLRTIHEVLEADRGRHIDTVVFNGVVETIDPGSGRAIRPCVVTVRTTRDTFAQLHLARVEPLACLKYLSAGVSASPAELVPVRPVREFNMVDARFVEETCLMPARRRFGRIRELPSGRYQARYFGPDGRQVGAGSFATKTEAAKALDRIEVDLQRGAWTDPRKARENLKSCAGRWVEQRPGLKPRTKELYEGLLRLHIVPSLGKTPIGELSPSQVRAWHAKLAAGMSTTTPAKAYRLLRAICATAVEDELILRNPCQARGAGQEHRPERKPPRMDEVAKLADAIEARYRLLVLLPAWATLRWGEAVGLRRRDFDRLHSTVTIDEQLIQLNGERCRSPHPRPLPASEPWRYPRTCSRTSRLTPRSSWTSTRRRRCSSDPRVLS